MANDNALTGFNIENFRTNILNSGYLQTNKFNVLIDPQSLNLLANVTQQKELLTYRADEIRIPGASLDITQVHRYGIGPNQKFPFNVNFTDITISFIDDSKASIWFFMDAWLRYAFGYGNNKSYPILYNSQTQPQNYQLQYKSAYVTPIQINVFNNEGSQILMINLIDAFPISLNDVTMSWSNNNNLYRTHVTFNFSDYNISTSP